MEQQELVSPELALVDSALAVRARADLPWRPWEAHAATEIVPLGPPPRNRRALSPALGIGGALGLAVLTLSVLPTRDPPTLAAFRQPKPPPRVTRKAPAPQPPPAQVKPAAKKRVVTPPPFTKTLRAAPVKKAAPRPKAAPAPKRRPAPPPPPAPPPKRTYSWKPFSGAIYYQVSFVRNGARIYQTQTRTPRVHLPAHVRLGAGRYSWTVRPAIVADLGIRLADPIVRRAFRVRGD
ncbi:MAG TPA: hypothetical protein VNB86_04740 [Gaiellaceae bacterium]|nr:hypothetical protein [Gaiellaceae bacterium]